MNLKNLIIQNLKEIRKISRRDNKKTAFVIGNTAKFDKKGFFLTPIRIGEKIVSFGIILFKEKLAQQVTKLIDGKVNFIFVDAEKKTFFKNDREPSNIERRVKENNKKSKLLIFKGNDLTVDSIDLFLSHYFKNDLRGVGGKKIAIIGAGNIGSKIALNLVERGAKVYLTRRNQKKLKSICSAINFIKPKNCREKAHASNFSEACKNADIVIGTADGKEVINLKMIKSAKKNCLIIDAGKGTISKEVLNYASLIKKNIFRTNVTAAFEGLVSKSLSMQKDISYGFNRKEIKGVNVVSSGLLGNYGEIIIDNLINPSQIYGISDGKGDFLRKLNKKQFLQLTKIKKIILNNKYNEKH